METLAHFTMLGVSLAYIYIIVLCACVETLAHFTMLGVSLAYIYIIVLCACVETLAHFTMLGVSLVFFLPYIYNSMECKRGNAFYQFLPVFTHTEPADRWQKLAPHAVYFLDQIFKTFE